MSSILSALILMRGEMRELASGFVFIFWIVIVSPGGAAVGGELYKFPTMEMCEARREMVELTVTLPGLTVSSNCYPAAIPPEEIEGLPV